MNNMMIIIPDVVAKANVNGWKQDRKRWKETVISTVVTKTTTINNDDTSNYFYYSSDNNSSYISDGDHGYYNTDKHQLPIL